MSKRSYRRLAAVTGAALAFGTMAPAMAARVSADGTADVDVTGVTLPSVDTGDATGLLAGLSGLAFSTVSSTQGFALSTVSGVQNDVTGIVGTLLSSDSLLSADADVNVTGGGASAAGVLDGSGLLGVVPAPGDVVGTALGLAGGVQQIASPVVATALTVPGTAIGLVSGAPDILFGLVNGVSLSGGGNAGLGASLASLL